MYFSIICFHYYSIIIHFFCFRIYKNRRKWTHVTNHLNFSLFSKLDIDII